MNLIRSNPPPGKEQDKDDHQRISTLPIQGPILSHQFPQLISTSATHSQDLIQSLSRDDGHIQIIGKKFKTNGEEKRSDYNQHLKSQETLTEIQKKILFDTPERKVMPFVPEIIQIAGHPGSGNMTGFSPLFSPAFSTNLLLAHSLIQMKQNIYQNPFQYNECLGISQFSPFRHSFLPNNLDLFQKTNLQANLNYNNMLGNAKNILYGVPLSHKAQGVNNEKQLNYNPLLSKPVEEATKVHHVTPHMVNETITVKLESNPENNLLNTIKHHFQEEKEVADADDYRHIYSGRLRNKPNQKYYYKRLKHEIKLQPQISDEREEQNLNIPINAKDEISNDLTLVDFDTKEGRESGELYISEKYRKRDYEGYVMKLHIGNYSRDEIKFTKIGEDSQANIPTLNPKIQTKKQKKNRDIRCVWNPEELDQIALEEYIKTLDEYIGLHVDNQEKAIKLLKKFKNSKMKVLESIRKNRAYYLTFLGVTFKNEKQENLT